MKLFYTPTSPYARATRIALRELALLDRVDEVPAALRQPDNAIVEHNPTGKAPTLITPDGAALSEAFSICEWLERAAGRAGFVPELVDDFERERFGVITGFVDGVSVWVREQRRPDGDRSDDILRQERERAARCTRWLNPRVDVIGGEPTFVTALLAAGLDRLSSVAPTPWQEHAPRLAVWAAVIESTPFFEQTRPGA